MARRKKKSSISWLHDIKADYTRLKKWNAKRLTINVKQAKERKKANEEIAKAKLESDALKAERKRAADARKAEKAAQGRARKAAAEARAQQTASKPQVVKARVVVPARPVAKKAAARPEFTARARAINPGASSAAVDCGARTEDGTPCQHLTKGGPCAAGHRPKGKPRSARKPRTWNGAPETPAETRFFNLRESGYMGPITPDGYRAKAGQAAPAIDR